MQGNQRNLIPVNGVPRLLLNDFSGEHRNIIDKRIILLNVLAHGIVRGDIGTQPFQQRVDVEHKAGEEDIVEGIEIIMICDPIQNVPGQGKAFLAGINDEGVFGILSDRVNASGMFVAIVSGLFVAYVMKVFSKRSLFKKDTQMPKFLVDSFDSMAPIIVIMVVAYVFCYLLKLDVYSIVNTALSPLLAIAQSLPGITLIMFLMAFFYSFGLSPWLLTPIYYTAGMDAIAKNAAAVAAGGKATLILTNETLGDWIWLGGTGCTLTLCIPSQSFLLWYMPIPIQTYLTNYDFRGVILVLLLLALTTVIWYPFVKAYDKQCLDEEAAEQAK